MESSDSTPTQPQCEFDRELPTPTADQLLDIEHALDQGESMDLELVALLYNDYLRQVAVIHELVQRVGGLNEVLEEVYRKVG